MSRASRTLLTLPAALLLLAACGGDDDPGGGDGGSATEAPGPSSPSDVPTSQPTAGGGQSDGAPAGSDAAADLEFDDQSGDGAGAVVSRVSAPQGGFVVVTVDDDDRPDDGTVLGWTAVDPGVSTDVVVPLGPRLDRDTDLQATLHADTDGDGRFDPAVDQPVPEPDDDDDDVDDDDVVDDDADYRLA
ncbi:DUF7282 domain-containing protein [Trujillonella humicola]|uniref:DUF7282 domain-containing protein n=1 Tax=Trujillonella humicola TaxID=3383699 RepID=UPI003905C041